MNMLSETVDVVIGVDTHKHTHTAAVVRAATGAEIEHRTQPTSPLMATPIWSPWQTSTQRFGSGPSRAPADMALASLGTWPSKARS